MKKVAGRPVGLFLEQKKTEFFSSSRDRDPKTRPRTRPRTPRASARLPPRPRRVIFFRSAECANGVSWCRGLVPDLSRVAMPRLPPSKASRDLFRCGRRRPALRCFPERQLPPPRGLVSAALRSFPGMRALVGLDELTRPYSKRTGGSETLSAVRGLFCVSPPVPKLAGRREEDPPGFWRERRKRV